MKLSLHAAAFPSFVLLSCLAGCGSSSDSDSQPAATAQAGSSNGEGGSSAAGTSAHAGTSAAGGRATGGASAGVGGASGSKASGGSAGTGASGKGGASAGVGGHTSQGAGGASNGGQSGATQQAGGAAGAPNGGSGGTTDAGGAGGNSAGGDSNGGNSAGGVPGGGAGGSENSAGSGGSDTGGSDTCGCHGMAGCAVWENVYITFYGFNDNSCTVESQHDCNDIAYPGLGPKMHQGANEGAGTYDDPITAAAGDQTAAGSQWETSGGATLSPGTLIYNPEVQKYFIMEDSCLECGDEWKCHLSSDDTDDPKPPAGCQPGTNLHIDFWMGPSFQQDASTLNDCEDNSTFGDSYKGTGVVIVNPPPDLPVKPNLLYSGTGTGGGCWTDKQVDGDSCN